MLPQLKKNADGSLTLYIQKDSPGEQRESNCLPAPDGPIYLVMRLYWPKTEPPSFHPVKVRGSRRLWNKPSRAVQRPQQSHSVLCIPNLGPRPEKVLIMSYRPNCNPWMLRGNRLPRANPNPHRAQDRHAEVNSRRRVFSSGPLDRGVSDRSGAPRLMRRSVE